MSCIVCLQRLKWESLVRVIVLLVNMYLQSDFLLTMSPYLIIDAFVDSWLSVYKDEWCNSLSAGMHEASHNLGLDHAWGGELCSCLLCCPFTLGVVKSC